jgi:hypothetical protein
MEKAEYGMNKILHLMWQINYKEEKISLTISYVSKDNEIAGTINHKNGNQLGFSSIGECEYLLDNRFVKGILI